MWKVHSTQSGALNDLYGQLLSGTRGRDAPGVRKIEFLGWESVTDQGTEGGTRTHKPLRIADFESAASAIPPLRLAARSDWQV